MISALLIFLFANYENNFYQAINKNKNKNFDYAYIFLLTDIVYFIIGLIYFPFTDSGFKGKLDFLIDWRFILYIILELIGMFTLNLNYINNKKNHTAINVGIFTTVLLTPIIVYFLDGLLGFNDTIKVSYFSNLTNILIFTAVYSIISLLYFYPKIKNKHVKNPIMILITTISLLLSFYIEVKLLQTYKFNVFIYAVFETLLSIIYFTDAIRDKEKLEKITKKHYIYTAKYNLLYYNFEKYNSEIFHPASTILLFLISKILKTYDA